MSYNIWLEIDTGGPEPAMIGPDINYTSNVSPMWRKALAGTGFDSLADMDGRTAAYCEPALRTAADAMAADPEAYAAMNPPNGWGSADGAREVLTRLAQACADHPKATVRISR
jgi:hypothetical protein